MGSTTTSSTAAPPVEPTAPLRLWLNADRVPPGPAEIVAVLVNEDDVSVTFGLQATVDRWDGTAWVPYAGLELCLVHWACTGEWRSLDEPPVGPDLPLMPTAERPSDSQRFPTDALELGWYRINQREEGHATGTFEVVDDAPQPPPLRPIDQPGIRITPALVTTEGATVRVSPVLVSDGGPIPGHAESPEVAALDDVVTLRRWDDTSWTTVTELVVEPVPSDPPSPGTGVVHIPPLPSGAYQLVRGGASEPHIGNLWVRPTS